MADYCWKCMAKLDQKQPVCSKCGFDWTAYTPGLHHLVPGTLLRDRYLIGTILGEGGFGITYVGWDTVLDTKIAVKEFYMTGYVSRVNTYSASVQVSAGNQSEVFEKNRRRFMDEARVLVKFRQEQGIVSVFDFFEDNNTAYIVMEFLEGETLKAYLKRRERLVWDATFCLFKPVMLALQQIHHQNIIHRDISPDNIMLLPDGQVKLLDFGAAREFSHQDAKSLSIILKPGYAPQEQYMTRGEQGPWTDVYALCATMYRCLTGQVPNESMERILDDRLRAPAELCDCPKSVSEVLMTGLAVRIQERWQSVEELLAALEGSERNATVAVSVPVSRETESPVFTEYTDDNDATVLAEESKAPVGQVKESAERKKALTDRKQKKTGKRGIWIAAALLAVVVLLSVAGVIARGIGIGKAEEPEQITLEQNTLEQNTLEQNTPTQPTQDADRQELLDRKEQKEVHKKEQEAKQEETLAEVPESVETESESEPELQLPPTYEVVAVGKLNGKSIDLSDWPEVVDVFPGPKHVLGLLTDGTVIAAGRDVEGQCSGTSDWSDIISMSAGAYHSVGLRRDGTVVTAGRDQEGQCSGTSEWTDIVAVAAGLYHTVGLREDGTVVTAGADHHGECRDTADWTDVVAIDADSYITVALRSDGTAYRAGANTSWHFDGLEEWTSLMETDAGTNHILGLRSDGTVVHVGGDWDGANNVGSWTDIVDIAVGYNLSMALRSDGTIVASGLGTALNAVSWNNISAIKAADYYVVGLIRKE